MNTQCGLGDLAKDKIIGFKGIVIARTEWLHGCTRITLQPEELKDGKPIESCTFDEMQIEVLKPRRYQGQQKTGGPRPEPKRSSDPR